MAVASLIERLVPGVALREQRIASLTEAVHQGLATNELLQESIAELQLAMEDIGWRRVIAQGKREFTRQGLINITAACQLYALKNPLIKRGLSLRRVYVWGQGVEISARANGNRRRAGEQDVNDVIQSFLDDPGNRRAFTGAAARERHELSLGTDGNLFVSLWTKPMTGKVAARILPWDEMHDVICNPDDRSEPWYYLRRWVEENVGADGNPVMTNRSAYYPAINYRPAAKLRKIGEVEVRWDAPVKHVKVNSPEGWKFGVPDAYAAIDWARAYKEFLEDWAKLVKALSRFAYTATTPGNKAAGLKAKLGATPSREFTSGEPNTAGSTIMLPPDITLEAVPKTGATIDSESGRPIAMMIAAALGVPVTMLLADPGQTGARATAETLDQPTELEMESRQQLWTDEHRDICEYVIRESVRAPQGALKGKIKRDDDGRETVTLAGDTDQTIDIVFPDLKDLDPDGVIKSIVAANGTGTVKPEIILRLLLTALGVRQVDELVDEMVDGDGFFQWPESPPIGGAGQSAVDALNAGTDPAAVDGGPMAGDNPPADSHAARGSSSNAGANAAVPNTSSKGRGSPAPNDT